MNTDEDLDKPEVENDIYSWNPKSQHDSSIEDQIFEKRSALEEIQGCEASLTIFKEIMPQSPSECNGLQLQNQVSGKKATVKQTETEERQFTVQPNIEHSGNMTQLQNESSGDQEGYPRLKSQTNGETDTDSQNEVEERQDNAEVLNEILQNMTQHQNESYEEHEGCPRMKSQTNSETDTGSQNEVEERQDNAEILNEMSRTKTSFEADNTKYGKFPVTDCAIYERLTMQGYNSSRDVLAEIVIKEGISEPISIILTETAISVPSVRTPESTEGKPGYNDSAFIQPEISAPSTYTPEMTRKSSGYNSAQALPTSCGKTADNLLSDDQREMTDGLGMYSGDLSQESKVGTKRKNSEESILNKKCKGRKSTQSEEERKRKNAEKQRRTRQKQTSERNSLKTEVETLRNKNHEKDRIIDEKDRIIDEKDRIIANLTKNNPPSDNIELDEEEFTKVMHQAEVEAFDPEKFLELMNNLFRSNGLSEINDKEPPAGIVQVKGRERMMKIRVLELYWNRKSDKERNKKLRYDLERNGLA